MYEIIIIPHAQAICFTISFTFKLSVFKKMNNIAKGRKTFTAP